MSRPAAGSSPESEESEAKAGPHCRPHLAQRIGRLCWVWLPVLLWMALILSLSSQSDLPVRTNPQTGEKIRTTFTLAKLAHVFEYSVLALLLLRALMSQVGGPGLPIRAAIIATVVTAGLFGGLDELRQSLVPNREPRLTDVALDTFSALAACIVVGTWQQYRRRKPIPGNGAERDPTAASDSGGGSGSSRWPTSGAR